MNKNIENYKNTYSALRPSDEAIERAMNMTNEKQKISFKLTYKRLAAAALALVLFIGGGFGINHFTNKSDGLTVLVAYAEDGRIKVGSASSQKIVKGLYFAPVDDEKACEKQHEKAIKDYNEYRIDFEELDSVEGPTMWKGVGSYDVYDENGKVIAKLYSSSAGEIVASKTDYSNVKSFTVENESEHALLQFEYAGLYEKWESHLESRIDEESPYPDFINHKFTLSGDELRKSQEDWGHYGYMLEWVSTAEVYDYPPDGITADFKASDIKDKITFTFENNDGSIETASVNITFDNYGHMHLE
ncbi:MAG: hypothetical protein IJR70_03205 [Eubacterium sp.]|nr:hypothetical protein [Eubacterium sp.]